MTNQFPEWRWWQFLLLWVLATTAGWYLGLQLWELDIELESELLSNVLWTTLLFSPLLLAGFGQWGVLYWRYRYLTGWFGGIIVSCLALLLISPIVTAMMDWIFPHGLLSNPDYYGGGPSPTELLLGFIAIYLMLGAAIALPQCAVLRRSLHRAVGWVVATVVAWLFSYYLLFYVDYTWLPYEGREVVKNLGWSLVMGLIPGFFLTLKTRNTNLRPASSWLRRLELGAGIVSALFLGSTLFLHVFK